MFCLQEGSVYGVLNFVAPAKLWLCYKVNFYKSITIKYSVLNRQLLSVIIQRALSSFKSQRPDSHLNTSIDSK